MKANHPDVNHLGNVKYIDFSTIGPIDLLIGGSPCQPFSRSGARRGFNDPKGKLFFYFVEALEVLKPDYFIYENVSMSAHHEVVINNHLGCQPQKINSADFSAQSRQRNIWTNITIPPIVDKGITFKHIRQEKVHDKYYFSPTRLKYIETQERQGKQLNLMGPDDKMLVVDRNFQKKISSQRFYAVPDVKGLRWFTPLDRKSVV